ncbi:superoxide dismutase family protein [Streptomyces odonnellii]|uniref:superoxide dismutase family protein n=1 Tax=Streptomyces odonnellii TaxID=1417980 RepID=UPI000A9B5923|nr:superoxide dismutase family protein [Streptomyces odonnellii]
MKPVKLMKPARIPRRASAALAVTALLTSPATSAFAQDGTRWVKTEEVRAAGVFVPPSPARLATALTYDVKLVPVGARIAVVERVGDRAGGHAGREAADSATDVRLGVSGLLPNRMYGAHVHTEPCGRTPEDAGPHYQNVKDPEQPSTDPAYANRENEVWLDFTTDSGGRAASESRHTWRFRPGGAGSVVIHEHGTATTPGEAGTAGARLACLTVPFE